MKKILIIHNQYKNLGGEDVAVMNEYVELKKTFNVEYLVYKNEFKNVIPLIISLITGKNIMSNSKLKKQIRTFQPDIAYVHNTWFTGFTGIFKILKKEKIKTLIKVHNFRFYCTKNILNKRHFRGLNSFCRGCGSQFNKYKLFNFYFKDSILKSIMMFFYSKRYLKILRDTFYTVIPITKFQIPFLIEIGVNEDNIKLNYNILNNVPDVADGPKENFLLYAGRISEEKGVEELIYSFLSLPENDYKLKIIGDGPILNKLLNLYKSERIIFTGNLTNDETIVEISKSQGVVLNTKLYEGQPTLLCEASLMAKPSVFPDTGGLKELFPKNYQFIFTQENYEELKQRMLELINSTSEQNNFVGSRNREFLIENINSNYLKRFKESID